MIIGFTGTRKGMTESQKNQVKTMLETLEVDELHHGDCIGADEEVHNICKEMNIWVCIHPPVKNSIRAFCEGAIKMYPPKEYIKRNHDIVDVCDILIATPETRNEKQQSGTWATIRYAKKRTGNVVIFYPEMQEA